MANQPIEITRKNETDFEIKCENEYFADAAESLLKRLCQFPAEYNNILKGKPSLCGSDIKDAEEAIS